MNLDLERRLNTLGRGEHVCPLYEDAAEQMAVTLPVIRDGLERGERCVFVVGDLTPRRRLA